MRTDLFYCFNILYYCGHYFFSYNKKTVKLELIQYNCPKLTYPQPFHHQVPQSNGFITQTQGPIPLKNGVNVDVSFCF